MPRYIFHLHDGATVTARQEPVEADGLDEARDLAGMRLMLSSHFSHVEVFEDGVERFQLTRSTARH